MAKIVLLIISVVFISCATGPKTKVDLSQETKDKLFATQNAFELYNSLNDPLFANLKNNQCLLDWQKYVFDLNQKMRQVTKNSERIGIWYELGNCYNYIQDYKKSLYYYDLVLSLDKRNKQRNSVILANIGVIYEKQGLDVLARSYYENSLRNNINNHIANYLLGLDHLREGDFRKANDSLETILRKIPNSRLVRSTLGVSFILSDNKFELKNKVFKFFNEKDEETVLFKTAIEFYDGKVSSNKISDLKDLELKNPIMNSFRKFLLTKFGNENG